MNLNCPDKRLGMVVVVLLVLIGTFLLPHNSDTNQINTLEKIITSYESLSRNSGEMANNPSGHIGNAPVLITAPRSTQDNSIYVVPNCIDDKPMYTAKPFLKEKSHFRELSQTQLDASMNVSLTSVFSRIFTKRLWGTRTASGGGSLLVHTVTMRKILNATISRLKKELNKSVISMLDVPCGDMNWMKMFLQGRSDINYTGLDIVPDLIEQHKLKFINETSRIFRLSDASKEKIRLDYDLIHTRHMTQHLDDAAVGRVLNNFDQSGSMYLLATDYPTKKRNDQMLPRDAGGTNFQNLQLPPFSLTPPVCMVFDTHTNFASLFQLPLKQVPMCNNTTTQEYVIEHEIKHGSRIYSCA